MLKYEGTDKIRDIKYEDEYVDKIYYDNNTLLVFTSDKEKTGVDEVLFKGRKLVDVISYGKCVQNGTPTPDAPVDIVSNNGVIKYGQYSNNIFNKNDTDNIDQWYSGSNQTIMLARANETLVMRAKPNTTYYFKHCSVKGGCRAFYTEVEDWEIGSACSTMSGNAVANANVVYSITTSANAKWIFFNYGRNNMETSFDDQRNDFMVSTSELTSNTPYEPYHFGIHVDGTVETINVHGKNIWNSTIEYKGYSSTGYSISNDVRYCGTLDKYKLTVGETYTVSYGNLTGSITSVLLSKWDSNGDWVSCSSATIDTTTNSVSFTVPNGVSEISLSLYSSSGITIDNNAWIQLELNSTATTYEPYFNGGTSTTEMLLKVDNYQDEQEILSGAITRNVEVLVLDGTENWSQATTSQGVYRYKFGPVGAPKIDGSRGHCASTHFFDIGGVLTQNVGGVFASTTLLYFIPNQDVSTVAGWQQWLANQYAAGTPVIVIYPLATSTTEQVLGQQMTIQQGNNIIEVTQASVDDILLKVKYK